jgi:hypothetical protein
LSDAFFDVLVRSGIWFETFFQKMSNRAPHENEIRDTPYRRFYAKTFRRRDDSTDENTKQARSVDELAWSEFLVVGKVISKTR